MRGSYVLLIELPERREIAIGGLGRLSFAEGYYSVKSCKNHKDILGIDVFSIIHWITCDHFSQFVIKLIRSLIFILQEFLLFFYDPFFLRIGEQVRDVTGG